MFQELSVGLGLDGTLDAANTAAYAVLEAALFLLAVYACARALACILTALHILFAWIADNENESSSESEDEKALELAPARNPVSTDNRKYVCFVPRVLR